jgi:lipopolysaccharide/colanic/teichoic acid biosynthesis glycosyltransferase
MNVKRVAKRAFDIAGSTVGIIALSPVFAVVAVTTAAHFRKSPFYIVERYGKGEKTFPMIKFRSMTSARDAQDNLLPDEQRRTKYGKFLRFTSIDELPQLFNVVWGNMSLVGPRPVGQDQYEEIIASGGRDIYAVKPGLTGPWQVNAIGQPGMPLDRKVALETNYVRGGGSFLEDATIMFKTLPSFIKGHNSPILKNKRSQGEIDLETGNETTPVNSL